MGWPNTDKEERNEAIYFDRLEGNTFESIAIKFKLCLQMVRQIFYRIERRRRYKLIKSITKENTIGIFKSPNDRNIVIVNDKSVFLLDLSVRGHNCLRNINIKTIGELCNMTSSELLKAKNMGRGTLNQIKDELEKYGLRLKDDPAKIYFHEHKCPKCGHEF